MKALQVWLTVLNVGAALSLQPFPYKVWDVTNASMVEGPESRIFGGAEAPEGKFPFMVFVLMKAGWLKGQCSASLINSEWVLLAAHCVYIDDLLPHNIIAAGGKADLRQYVSFRITNFDVPIDENLFEVQERRAKSYYYHPNFNAKTLEHDVALIRTNGQFRLDSKVALIPLSQERMKNRKMCTIVGWGLTSQDRPNFKLNYAEKLVSTTKLGCKYKLSGPFICLARDNSGICQGDSGSPLVCDGTVWGVASHLVSANDDPECGNSLEEYYSELYEDLDWVKSYSSGNLGAVAGVKSVFLFALGSVWLSVYHTT